MKNPKPMLICVFGLINLAILIAINRHHHNYQTHRHFFNVHHRIHLENSLRSPCNGTRLLLLIRCVSSYCFFLTHSTFFVFFFIDSALPACVIPISGNTESNKQCTFTTRLLYLWFVFNSHSIPFVACLRFCCSVNASGQLCSVQRLLDYCSKRNDRFPFRRRRNVRTNPPNARRYQVLTVLCFALSLCCNRHHTHYTAACFMSQCFSFSALVFVKQAKSNRTRYVQMPHFSRNWPIHSSSPTRVTHPLL